MRFRPDTVIVLLSPACARACTSPALPDTPVLRSDHQYMATPDASSSKPVHTVVKLVRSAVAPSPVPAITTPALGGSLSSTIGELPEMELCPARLVASTTATMDAGASSGLAMVSTAYRRSLPPSTVTQSPRAVRFTEEGVKHTWYSKTPRSSLNGVHTTCTGREEAWASASDDSSSVRSMAGTSAASTGVSENMKPASPARLFVAAPTLSTVTTPMEGGMSTSTKPSLLTAGDTIPATDVARTKAW